MLGSYRIVLLIVSVLTMWFTLHKIRQSKIKIEYSLFWIILSVMLVILSLFPQIASFVSEIIGFQSPVNFIFPFIIFLLLIKLFYNSLLLSMFEKKIEGLAQESSILEERVRKLEEEKRDDEKK
ncbi:MAG: DUF2304 domain-containing protein [Lachnospiraceae bacterium]|nr:DUF2304 domain-containing protein [Lachnospiraceae bacterium]